MRTAAELERLLSDVGPEPSQMTADEFARMAKKARKPIKLLLLDQKRVSGLGNIYAAEALFRAKVNPKKLASTLSLPRLRSLHQCSVDTLAEAMDSVYYVYADPGHITDAESLRIAVYEREGEAC